MAPTESRAVVVDAGPLIHLDQLGCLDLLSDLAPVTVPQRVLDEVNARRHVLHIESIPGLVLSKSIGVSSLRLVTLIETLDLGVGEASALAILTECGGGLLLTDDAAARLAAESLGFRVHGTIGILVRAIRRGLRSREEALRLLQSIPAKTTLFIKHELLNRVIEEVKAFTK